MVRRERRSRGSQGKFNFQFIMNFYKLCRHILRRDKAFLRKSWRRAWSAFIPLRMAVHVFNLQNCNKKEPLRSSTALFNPLSTQLNAFIRSCKIGSIEIENIDPHKSAPTAGTSRSISQCKMCGGGSLALLRLWLYSISPSVDFFPCSHANLKFDFAEWREAPCTSHKSLKTAAGFKLRHFVLFLMKCQIMK